MRCGPASKCPPAYIKDGKIVLNLSVTATQRLQLKNDGIEFDARFAGVVHHVRVPMAAVLGVYARETGEGMIFSEAETEPTPPQRPTSEGSQPASPDTRRAQTDRRQVARSRSAGVEGRFDPFDRTIRGAQQQRVEADVERGQRGLAAQQVARCAHDARALGSRDAGRRAAECSAAAQPHFGDDQQPGTARDDVELPGRQRNCVPGP